MRPDPYAWAPHPEALAAVVLIAAAYAAAAPRFAASRLQIASFATGLVLIAAAVVTLLHALSFHLLSMHLLQNVVLAEWAPALLVVGIPPALATALGRNGAVRLLTRPPLALALWLVTYFTWHVPLIYDTALRHPHSLLHAEHASYLVAGCLLWWPVVQDAPHRLATGARAGYLFAAFLLASPLGLLLALLPEPIYDFYERGRVWGLSQIADQQLAGATMAGEQSLVFFAAFAWFFFRFLAEEESKS
jgi:cytochrome c oxidase assembly factor CtaG